MRYRLFRSALSAALFLLAGALQAGQFIGTTSGVFYNPQPPCVPPILCSGVNTATVSWGSPMTGTSSATFAPASFDVDPGVTFTVGYATLSNRTIVLNTSPDYFTLTITASIDNIGSSAVDVSRTVTMQQVSTQNTNDPIASEDWITFIPDIAAKSFFVLEDSSETVELKAVLLPGPQISSFLLDAVEPSLRLELVGFGNVLGPNGFVADTPTPEPGSLLVAAGALLLGLVRLKRRSGR